MDGKPWCRYLMQHNKYSVVDLAWVVNELRAVKEGRARVTLTPDGILTILYGA